MNQWEEKADQIIREWAKLVGTEAPDDNPLYPVFIVHLAAVLKAEVDRAVNTDLEWLSEKQFSIKRDVCFDEQIVWRIIAQDGHRQIVYGATAIAALRAAREKEQGK